MHAICEFSLKVLCNKFSQSLEIQVIESEFACLYTGEHLLCNSDPFLFLIKKILCISARVVLLVEELTSLCNFLAVETIYRTGKIR